MLAYQHAYHAGNFADVHKHLGLFHLLEALTRKSSAISFVDTHAGRGLYPLAATETQKLAEYREGVERLWRRRQALAAEPALGAWLARLATLQAGPVLECYPGSPWWLGDALRPQDRLTLYELHPGEHQHLDAQAPIHANAQRLHADGLKGLCQRLPVPTPRLCALIDPSYERKEEYREVVDTLVQVVRKVRHAVVMIWYPLLPAGRHLTLLEGLREARIPKLWRSEITLREANAERGMYGSGLVLLNPPWQLDQTLDNAFATLAPLLAERAVHHGEWWTAER